MPGNIMSQAASMVHYTYDTYRAYDNARGADAAKKRIERHLVQELTEHLKIGAGLSLDIGCATGRYPMWFASRGFEAIGYDASPVAIRYCRQRRIGPGDEGRMRFEVRDVVADPLPHDEIAIITSMMGTINHLPARHHAEVIAKYYGALTKGGALIMSGWHPDCPYQGFLGFYDAADREILARNSRRPDRLEAQLREAGFVDLRVRAFCFIPDAFYDAWIPDARGGDEASANPVWLLDEYARALFPGSIGQMYLISGRKA